MLQLPDILSVFLRHTFRSRLSMLIGLEWVMGRSWSLSMSLVILCGWLELLLLTEQTPMCSFTLSLFHFLNQQLQTRKHVTRLLLVELYFGGPSPPNIISFLFFYKWVILQKLSVSRFYRNFTIEIHIRVKICIYFKMKQYVIWTITPSCAINVA